MKYLYWWFVCPFRGHKFKASFPELLNDKCIHCGEHYMNIYGRGM